MKRKRKKIAAGMLAAVMVMSGGSITAFAAGQGNGRNFADTNEDGICDNYGVRPETGRMFADENGDGICDHCESKIEAGKNFTDTNGDGICDHYGDRQRIGRKNREKKGCRNGRGRQR